MTAVEIEYVKRLYNAEVESMDERVGLLINALRAGGVLENTYIVFTSDHSELFGEHGLMGHIGVFYDDLVRIP